MSFTPKPLRYIIATAALVFFGYSWSHGQLVCEKGFYSDYTSNGHLLPASVTSLRADQQVITGQASLTQAGRLQSMVARIAENGDVLWSFAMDAGEGAALKGMLEKANGQYIVYGNLYSAADPDGKIWIACLNQAGNLQWSRVIESGQPGAERLYSLIEMPDGDLVGTFNIADSTVSSRPVVFRMHDNGTLSWTREYAQSEAVAFNSLAFANNRIYAAGSQRVVRKKPLIMLLDAATGDIVERRYPSYYNPDIDQETAFIEIFNNRISYVIRYQQFSVLVQSTLDNTTLLFTARMEVEPDPAHTFIRRTRADDFLIMRNNNGQTNLAQYSQFGEINWSRRLSPYYNNGQVHNALDIANGGAGGISVGHYLPFLGVTHMRVVKMNSKGNGGNCTDYGFTFSSDTIHLINQIVNWSGVPANAATSIQSSAPIISTPLVIQKTEECATATECTDLAALNPGCNKTMMVEYATPYRSILSDAVALGDGSRIAVGQNSHYPYIIKLKDNGDVEWSRLYNQSNWVGELKRTVRLTANTVLVAGNVYTRVDHYAYAYNYLLKIDNNGNILSSQILSSYGGTEVADIIPTDDGGFLLVEVGIYGFPPIYNFVTRFDANMQVVWKKRLDVFAGNAISRSVYISNGKIYLGHEYYNPTEMWAGVVKMDLATGNFEWTRAFEIATDNSPLRFNRVFAVNDTVYAFVTKMGGTSIRQIMVRINPHGQVIDGKSIGDFDLVQGNAPTQWDISRPTVTLTTDLDFVTANLVKTPGGRALNISRFNRHGQPAWSRNYDYYNNHTVYNIRPHASGYQMVGRVQRSETQFDINFMNSFFLKTDSVGKLTLASTGDCAPIDAPYTSNSVAITTISDSRVLGLVDNDWLTIKTLNVSAVSTFTDATLTCHRLSDCNPVTLGMSGNNCQVNQPVKLFLENNNCGATVKWTFDPNYFQQLSKIGDTLTLMPQRAGASTILAGVEDDCTYRELSTPISIAVTASSLELGRDTVICANNTLSLKAGQGYQSYLWNNGSSDTELQVTSPGKYYVRVTDYCGNEASDTVLVADPQESFAISGPLQKCNTDTIRLTVPNTFSNIVWSASNYLQASGNSANIFPLQNAEVSVQAEWLPGCVVKDTVDITVLHSPDIDLGTSIDICYNDTISLTAPVGFSNYNWNTGENSNEIRVHNAGTYHVTAMFPNGCFSYDTVVIRKRIFTSPDLGPDKSICNNVTSYLTPGNYSQYVWSTGANTQQLPVAAPGVYSVTVTDNFGCEGADTMQIISILDGPTDFLPTQMQFCPGQELSITSAGFYEKYEWSTGWTRSTVRVKDTGMYFLHVVDFNGCAGIDSVSVQYGADCPQAIHFPNAFTPNGDQVNDRFAPKLYGIVTNYVFEIYNRWGQRVFYSVTPNEGWDGRIKGTLQNNDVFAWKCSWQFPGQAVQKQGGVVMLVR